MMRLFGTKHRQEEEEAMESRLIESAETAGRLKAAVEDLVTAAEALPAEIREAIQ